MIPDVSALPDILCDLVSHSDSVAAAGQGQEEEEEQALSVRQVGTNCPICGRGVIRIILSTVSGVRQLQDLLLSEHIQLICNRCVRHRLFARNNGRP